MKHFLKETDFNLEEIKKIFPLAKVLKKNRNKSDERSLYKQSWGMLFFLNSTRTFLSFKVGIHELGGNAILLDPKQMQLNRGESITHTAQIVSRYLHGLIIRCVEYETIEAFALESSIPVINALTSFLHPCQIYSDAFTLAERWAQNDNLIESLKGRKIAFLGDTASNMANSWLMAANLFGMELFFAGPKGFEPEERIKNLLREEGLGQNYIHTTDPIEAVKNADVVYTDVWTSMGNEIEKNQRIQKMKPYAVTKELMKHARSEAYFMHCLPVHKGQEVSQEVLDSSQSIIFDQAENRLHVQKAIMTLLAKANS
jgi:ornithine carbamoyltransferase